MIVKISSFPFTLISYIDSQNLERGSTYDIQSEMAILHMKKVHYVLEDQSLYDTVNIPSIQVFKISPLAQSPDLSLSFDPRL